MAKRVPPRTPHVAGTLIPGGLALPLTLLAGPWLAAAACDGSPRALDASARPALEMAAVAVRFEVPEPGSPSASVLAFRASYAGVEPAAVLGLVDPLAEESPPLAAGCALRDADMAATSLGSRRASVELIDLPGLEVTVGPARILRPPASLYPDLGTEVGGLVSEAGPAPIPALPEEISIRSTELVHASAVVPVPAPARVLSITGGHQFITLPGDVEVVTSAPDVTVEIRPFGATGYVSCRTGSDGRVNLPGSLVERAAGANTTHLSLDVVRREVRPVNFGGQPVSIQVEVRSSRVLELHR